MPESQTDSTSGALGADTSGAHDPAPSFYIRVGFFTSLGVVFLAICALAAYKLLAAFADVATPFVVGTFLALLLDPVAHRLERTGLHRTWAIIAVVSSTVLILVGLAALVIPRFVEQVNNLATNGPGYIIHLQTVIDSWLKHDHRIGPIAMPLPHSTHDVSVKVSAQIAATLQGSAGNLIGILSGSATTILQMVVSLLVMFYVLADTEQLMGRALFLVPSRYRANIQVYSRDIGKVFSDYLRGMLIVCSFYGITVIAVLYALSIWTRSLAGYALLVGVFGGVLYSIPYVGACTIALMTFVIGFTAGGLPGGMATMLCVLAVNWTYDNLITPRIVGGGVGLHPVAAIMALALGGRLAGFWGLLLSVPVAASIQAVLFRIFPRLTNPTPDALLRSAHTVEAADAATPPRSRRRRQPKQPATPGES
ncbi:MAG: AI-2E family transporter [Capsulimonadaceae bacterium]|nr:AI-2E family transporter [Capsulimonadaceae bacterium]